MTGSLLLILGIRWALIEPYVIPSESMLPTLLVHDHIFVNKFAYGFRLPFAQKYLFRYSAPSRGDVLVFRSVEDPQVFLVKRVVGLPGDRIEMRDDGLYINNAIQKITTFAPGDADRLLKDWQPADRTSAFEQYTIYREDLESHPHPIFRDKLSRLEATAPVTVPPDHYFMSGDNRDHSSDSRVFGPLPFDHILGRASVIWLSCEEALVQSGQLCNPQTIRWGRLFSAVL